MTQRVSVFFGMERKSEYINDLLAQTGIAPGPKMGFHVVPSASAMRVDLKNSDDATAGNTLIHRHGVRVEETDNLVQTFALASGAAIRTYACVCRYVHSAGSTPATFHMLEVGINPFTANDTLVGLVSVPALHVGVLPASAIGNLARQRYMQPDPSVPIFTVDHPISNVFGEESVEDFQTLNFSLVDANAYTPNAGYGNNWQTGADTYCYFNCYMPSHLSEVAAARDPLRVFIRLFFFNKAATITDKLYLRFALTDINEAAFPPDTASIGPQQYTITKLGKWDYYSIDFQIPAAFVSADRMIRGIVGRVGTNILDTVTCYVELHGGIFFYPINRPGRQY